MLETIKEFFKQYGSIGLFFNAFFDGFILPLPPDFLLSTLVMQKIGNPTALAMICSVGSVIGGCIGYCIGRFGGRPIVNKIFSNSKFINKAEEMFTRFGVWAIVIDAFTPIPYKAITLGSGLMKFNPILFAAVSFPVRSTRYILVANTANFIGEQLRTEFERTLLVIIIMLIVFVFLIYNLKKKFWAQR